MKRTNKLFFLVLLMSIATIETHAWPGSGTSSKPYLIETADDWTTLYNNISNGEPYFGKYFRLTNDITVTQMLGSYAGDGNVLLNKCFSGTFDGYGHTLTFNKTTNAKYIAPFRLINGATIMNLHVSGSITTSTGTYAAGLVAYAIGTNTISNCQVSTTIASQTEGVGYHGGIVAKVYAGTTNITDCLFDGELTGSTTTCGGFVGWTRNDEGGTVNIANCLFDPATATVSSTGSYTFACGDGTINVTDSYYTTTLGTVQGTDGSAADASGLVASLGTNWYVSTDSQAVPVLGPTYIKLDDQGATTAGTTEVTAFRGHDMPAITIPEKDGFSFAGYYTQSVSGGILYYHADGSSAHVCDLDQDATLYAQWKKSLLNASITIAPIEDQTYTGEPIEPSVTIQDGDMDITSECDITYSSNTIVGTATVTIAAKTTSTEYTGLTTTTFTINKATLVVDAPVPLTPVYNGEAQPLVSAGNTNFGTLLYSTDGLNYQSDIPTATNAGSYTLYYMVAESDNWNEATPQTVAVTITKHTSTINYATDAESKTFGDGAFTKLLLNNGDGQVTYGSNNETVATVDAATGEVTIVNSGSAVITATVVDGNNYTYDDKTASYTLTVANATMTAVSAIGYTGTYDGSAHGISVTAPEGAIVKYGTEEGTCELSESPTFTNVGTYIVYYEVTKDNYNTVTGSQTVTIGNTTMEGVSSAGYEGIYDGSAHGISVTAPEGATVKYGTEEGTYELSGSPTFTDTGTYTVYYQVTMDNHTTITGSQTVNIANATLTGITARGYEGVYDGDSHGISVTAPRGAKVKYGTREGTYNQTVSPRFSDAGIYTVYYQVTMANYNTVTGSQTVTIDEAYLEEVSSTGYAGTYDGKAHGISVTVPEGATVWYGTEEYTYDLSESPLFTNAGTYTVYYQVTKDNYTTITGSQTVEIAKATMTSITVAGYVGPFDNEAHGITVVAPEGATVLYGTTERNCILTKSPTFTDVGRQRVYYRVVMANYNDVTGSAWVYITAAQLTDNNKPITIDGETYYPLTSAVAEETGTASNTVFPAIINSSMFVKNGQLNFITGANIDMIIRDLRKGQKLTIQFEGKLSHEGGMLQVDDSNEVPRHASGATLNLVSGVDYEVLEDGNVKLTFVLGDDPAVLKSITITDNSATAISRPSTLSTKGEESDNWYTLDGRRLQGAPAQKGVYIVNGKKYYNKR